MSKFYLGNTLIIDPDVKLERVLITQEEYDALTEKDAGKLYVITDAENPLEEIQDIIDQHLENSTNGLNHIPANGLENQVLSWIGQGKAAWTTLNNILPNLEDLLAYGVEWDINVADPHLTRIGNMSMHKTLPIQSLLKGCIAQGGKIIYWLDENDWRFKKEPDIYPAQVGETFINWGIYDIPSVAVGLCVKVRGHIGRITSSSTNELGDTPVEWEDWESAKDDLYDSEELELGSRLDGYDGTVRVYCPGFYIKSKSIGDKRQVWISTVKIDGSWTYLPAVLIDAYRSTVLNEVPENMGYLSTLPVNSAISVVNTATYCRGGNNNPLYDTYLSDDEFKTYLGKPRTQITRTNIREYSRNANSEPLSYDLYKNIFYWLYVIEYANFNSLEEFKDYLTEEGFHLGGLGPGLTTITESYWSNYNQSNPITPCGYLNDVGNQTSTKSLRTGTIGSSLITMSFVVPRWRGFDNPFGDIWTNLDGIILINNKANYVLSVYTCQNPSYYSDTLDDINYLKICDIRTDSEDSTDGGNKSGIIKEFVLKNLAHIIPLTVDRSVSASTFTCDNAYVDTRFQTLCSLIVGGACDEGYVSGLGYWLSALKDSVIANYIGFRTVSTLS